MIFSIFHPGILFQLYSEKQLMSALLHSLLPMLAPKPTHSEHYIQLTYQSGIERIFASTFYSSDAGWGCMLRVAQMFVANLYYKRQAWPLQEILRLFYDNLPVAFCLPAMTDTAGVMFVGKRQYEWFSPLEAGLLLKAMLDKFDAHYRTSVCADNTIFLDQIQQDRQNLIIMVMCRIGLHAPQKQYLQCVMKLMQMRYFNSILGGTPRRAHLFLKYQDGYVGYLDPHSVQKVAPFEELGRKQSKNLARLRWMQPARMDCSMAVTFVVPRSQVEQFWAEMEQVRDREGSGFFLYMARNKPELNDGDEVIEL